MKWPLLILLAVAMAGAQFWAEGQAQSQASAWFRKLDRNRDGYLQREEVSRLRGIPEVFDEADANGDGKLDPEEFVRAEAILQKAKLRSLPPQSKAPPRTETR